MFDFVMISTRENKTTVEIYPKFIIKKSSDLMIRGGDFYAVWIEEKGLWATDEQEVFYIIDAEIQKFYLDYKKNTITNKNIKPLYLWDAESRMVDAWHKYCQKQMRDDFVLLDKNLIFSNMDITKKDYATRRLPYPLKKGDLAAYDRLMSVLYSKEERHKIEWAIGSIVTGDSKKIQKFMVLYGSAGTGKSTVLNIIQKLFEGYYAVFDAKALGSSSNSFALEAFKTNPLVAIQHDGDLSRIEDNTRLNSLVSHEEMTVNEKFHSAYTSQFMAFLFMGTNKPVKITDAKSGLLRRLIDVSPTGNKLSSSEYKSIVKKIDFELGAIACHCRDVYLKNPGYYDDYVPKGMMGASNDFYNFIIDSYHVFKKENGTTLKAAWEMYKSYCDDAKVMYPFNKMLFKEELKNYFKEYSERFNADDGTRIRSYYQGFKTEIFEGNTNKESTSESEKSTIIFDCTESIFDKEMSDCPAQYATSNEIPMMPWDDVDTKLSELKTSKLHYVKVPENHIVIDFDIPDENGNKSFEKNLEAASKWPPTYAELSKSGAGIHLHYIYAGDSSKLSRIYDNHIEVKVFNGKSSLRRKLSKCNNLPIATISSGLPLKGEKMVNFDAIKSEKGLRTLIKKNLGKEIHPGTKPSIDFIYKILEEAYSNGLQYDVTDMRPSVLAFAANSTHQAEYCVRLVNKMQFKSEDSSDAVKNDDEKLVFYDVEVFPNLFLVNWKFQGKDKPGVRMINPTSVEVEDLMKFRLVGFNCRRYDNHILYARMMGYSNEELYKLSQRIINKDKEAFFGEAYNVSYTDIYDFCSTKQSLKKWEIELGIHHQELGLPWDKPVPEELWTKVAEYCDNDVIATEAVFDARQADWIARQILANIAGMSVNDTTNSLTTRIIFGKERHPKLVYTDLATGKQTNESKPVPEEFNAFPGYTFEFHEDDKKFHNIYMGTDLGMGGYVYAQPGMWGNVALLDVASLHPHSAIALNAFGDYTKNFEDLVKTRIYIKHKEYDKAKKLFDGKLATYLDDPAQAKALAQALKIAINSVYGLTSATFSNPFKDPRNKNNIVALRGALFMRYLQGIVENMGYTVAHIKTDSIKIVDASKEIIDLCMQVASEYGYTFEHEATYEKMCLVNDAVYIAKYADKEFCKEKYGYIPEKNEDHPKEWTATGTQFQVPYVFKTLFSKEPIQFEDMCETKSVTSALYLDMNEGLENTEKMEKELYAIEKGNREPERQKKLRELIAKNHNYRFIGKVGQFCPIQEGYGGGELVREADGKYYSVTGTKGYRWQESEVVRQLGKEDCIDQSYYKKLVDEAVKAISQYGDFEWFVSDDTLVNGRVVPWESAGAPWDETSYPYDVR